MTTITLSLPEQTMAQARRAAEALNKPVEEVLSDMVTAVLPVVQDAPEDVQLELTRMTWLDNQALWQIARRAISQDEQEELHRLAERQAAGRLSSTEWERLEHLRHEYGRVTLRKARAYALLSLRAGKPLLN
jgi:RNA:NAD 2'-phosphotransferase (TPT1/KptA family)